MPTTKPKSSPKPQTTKPQPTHEPQTTHTAQTLRTQPPAHKDQILIVEDDADIASLEKDYLELEGLEVDIIGNGRAALTKIRSNVPDLILLDVMLPGLGGFEICQHIREFSDVPIIIVTAKDAPLDIIKGLGLGSDDYVTKPFDPAVLVARVKSSLSRFRSHKNLGSEITIGTLRVEPASRRVFKNGEELRLPNREFALLDFFLKHSNTIITKTDLFEAVWGLDSLADEATVTVHINRLREKIELDPAHPTLIETIWGVGYRFNR